MRFAIVRSADPACEPNCAEWISAEGIFRNETEGEFRKVLNALGKRKLPILIHSRGGNGIAAMAVGRMVRAHQLDVAVSKTEIETLQCPGQGLPHGSGLARRTAFARRGLRLGLHADLSGGHASFRGALGVGRGPSRHGNRKAHKAVDARQDQAIYDATA